MIRISETCWNWHTHTKQQQEVSIRCTLKPPFPRLYCAIASLCLMVSRRLCCTSFMFGSHMYSIPTSRKVKLQVTMCVRAADSTYCLCYVGWWWWVCSKGRLSDCMKNSERSENFYNVFSSRSLQFICWCNLLLLLKKK